MDVYSVIARLLNSEEWPTYTNRDKKPDLSRLASDAYDRDTFDGYLSFVLISHQELEDYAVLLLRHAQFTVRLHLAGSGFGWPEEKYEEQTKKPKAMFGQVLQDLSASVDFDTKSDFVSSCQRQNEIRNQLSHRLIDGIDFAGIRALAKKYRAGCSEVTEFFNEADEQFSSGYFLLILDPRWDRIIGDELRSASTDADRNKWRGLRSRIKKKRHNSPLKQRTRSDSSA